MKIQITRTGLTQQQLLNDLRRQFPSCQVVAFGRQLLVSDGVLQGVGVVLSRDNVSVHPGPASITQFLVFAGLAALCVVPGLVFLGVQIVKSGPLADQVGGFIAQSYRR